MINYNKAKLDSRTRLFYSPTRIVKTESGNGTIHNQKALLSDSQQHCTLEPGQGEGPSIIIDFGMEIHGGVSIDINGISPNKHARINVRFGESVSEVMGSPNTDHAFHEFTLDFPCISKQEVGLTGFRFIRIELIDQQNSVNIRQVQAVGLERPWKYEGNFECSDPLINEIWQIGARTVHLCCQDYIFDGIKRDRMVWMGDIHPQIHVIAAAFGEQDIVNDSFNILCQQWPADTWMNRQCSYGMWWVISLWEWYWYTGNKSLLQEHADFFEQHINYYLQHIDPQGRECLTGHRLLDWATADDEIATTEGLQTLFIWMMRNAILIADTLKIPEIARRCIDAEQQLRKATTNQIDNLQVQALRALTELDDAAIVNQKFLSSDPCRGLSPWFGYYVLNARALANDYTGCLELIREYWGDMVKLGATSFWEHFDTNWSKNASRIDELPQPDKHDVHVEYGSHCFKGLRHSLCHGWSAGPTAWLSANVLGVVPVSPGFKQVSIIPNLGDLEFAKGTVPTPYGSIHVKHTKDKDGKIHTETDIPSEIQVIP